VFALADPNQALFAQRFERGAQGGAADLQAVTQDAFTGKLIPPDARLNSLAQRLDRLRGQRLSFGNFQHTCHRISLPVLQREHTSQHSRPQHRIRKNVVTP